MGTIPQVPVISLLDTVACLAREISLGDHLDPIVIKGMISFTMLKHFNSDSASVNNGFLYCFVHDFPPPHPIARDYFIGSPRDYFIGSPRPKYTVT